MPYALEPMVAGELGRKTKLDASTHPPLVSRVEYLLDDPDPDDLIESFPVFLVSVELAPRLDGLTGFTLADARVRRGGPFLQRFGRAAHPDYRWLQVHGTSADDCWIGEDLRLRVSARMMAVLRGAKLDRCDVQPC